jgi:Spy/CpxP family protein refolding chaperone
MKKILALLVLCSVIITVNAQVQRKKTTPIADSAAATANKAADNKGGRKDMMKELHLTKLQKHKLKEMRLSGKTKMSEIQNDAKLSEEEKKTKLKELRKQQMESTLAVLNDEQKAKFKKMQKGKKQGKREEMELEQ